MSRSSKLSTRKADGLTTRAMEFAAEAHRRSGEPEKADGTPFAAHAGKVAQLVADAGLDEDVVAAAALHDVLEHTEVEPKQLRRRFGARITRLVEAVSDDSSIKPRSRRKAALRQQAEEAGPDAMAIYLADKLVNLRTLRKRLAKGGEEGGRAERRLGAKLRNWGKDLAMVTQSFPATPHLGEFELELKQLQAEAAALSRP